MTTNMADNETIKPEESTEVAATQSQDEPAAVPEPNVAEADVPEPNVSEPNVPEPESSKQAPAGLETEDVTVIDQNETQDKPAEEILQESAEVGIENKDQESAVAPEETPESKQQPDEPAAEEGTESNDDKPSESTEEGKDEDKSQTIVEDGREMTNEIDVYDDASTSKNDNAELPSVLEEVEEQGVEEDGENLPQAEEYPSVSPGPAVVTGEQLEEEQGEQAKPDDFPEAISPKPEAWGEETQKGVEELLDDEEEEEEEEEEEVIDREQLIERYHAAIAERDSLKQKNTQLQHKLGDYFRRKKSEETRSDEKSNVDQEHRYLKYMGHLEELKNEYNEMQQYYMNQIEDLKDRCYEKLDEVSQERDSFFEFKKKVASDSINSRSGKPIPERDIESYIQAEMRKEQEVIAVRLENIKLKNKLKKKEHALKSKEELAEGLHLIDFEQLKIENQTYNEKIEERNEELLKLRKKITSTVQVMTHLKEKLQFVQAENQTQKTCLRDIEEEVAKKRDRLTRTKRARDQLRIDNQKLRQNCGLLGNETLLRDFEDKVYEAEDMGKTLEKQRVLHADLSLNTNRVRKKIEQAKLGRT